MIQHSRRARQRRNRFLKKRNRGPAELLEPRILLIGDPIELQQSPTDVGHFVGFVASDLDTANDVDQWEFEALAGDQIVFAVDTPDSQLNPTVSLRNASDGSLGTNNDGGPGTDAYFGPFTIATTGTYSARVAGQGNTVGDYDLRVQLVRDGIQLEQDVDDRNGVLTTATPLLLGVGGSDTSAQIAGNISAPNGETADVDTFLIGRMNAGVVVTLATFNPVGSTLDADVRLVDAAGSVVTDADGQNDSVGNFTTPEAGEFYAQVSAKSGAGSNATYVLSVDIEDDIPPEVVSVTGLPPNGESQPILSNSFSATFDESLLATSIAEDSVTLVGAGDDELFDTADDFEYNVRNLPDYQSGALVEFLVDGGRAVAGEHRLRIRSTVTDSVGNALDGNADGVGGDDYEQFFTVTLPQGSFYTFENLDNATRDLATPLPLDQDPDHPEAFRAIGFGIQEVAGNNTWTDEDWWSFEAESEDRIILSVDSNGSAIDSYVELYDANGRFVASDSNGGPNQDAMVSNYRVLTAGRYYARVGNGNSNPGKYQIRIDLSRGIDAETDANYDNDPLNRADGLTLDDTGNNQRASSIAGQIQATEGTNQDEDTFNIGLFNPGDVLSLAMRLPSGSTLVPRIDLFTQTGERVASVSDGLELEFNVVAFDRYYARVSAVEGEGPDARYILDVSVGDTRPPEVTSISRLSLPSPSQAVYETSILETSPSVYWKLNETEGTTLADSSGNAAVDGQISGDGVFGVDSVFGVETDKSIGIGDQTHLEFPDSDRIESTRAVSFSFWMKPDSFANTWMPLVFKGTTNGNQRSYALWLQNNGNLQFNTADATGNEAVNTGASVVQTGQWHHIAASIDRDKGVMQLWVDGVRRAGQGIRTNDIRLNDNPLLVGHTLETSSSYSKFDGTIDELAVWTSAIDSNQLLAPYYESQWLGEPRSTNQLISTFAVGFSESLIPGTVNYQGTNFRTFDGNTYFISNTTRNREDASAYAESFGGNLVTITSQEEQDFINQWLAPQNRDYWLGLRDVAQDDNFAWDTGEALEYTHWWQSYPRPGAEDGVRFNPNSNDGRWWNIRTTDAYNTIVEIQGDQDTDADGIPDVIDRRPNDPLNAWEIRNAGPDQTFDTDDDKTYDVRASFNGSRGANITIADGPLPPGQYRITITDAITDVVGNPLDGDLDGTPGQDFVQFFAVDALPENTVLEQPLNNIRQRATKLELEEDETLPGFFLTENYAVGSQDPATNNTWSDEDWWSFDALNGDRVSITMDTPNSAVNSYVELYDANGRFLAADDNGGPNIDANISGYNIPGDGEYFFRVGSSSNFTGNYQIRIGLSRGTNMETDAQYNNDSIANADGISLIQDGATRSGSIFGLIQGDEGTNRDEDRFNLGILTAGNTVELNLDLPATSTLDGRVFLVDSDGKLVPDDDGDTENATYRATLTSDGTYYADVRANTGQGPNAYYKLNVSLGDAEPPQIQSVSRLPLPAHGRDEYRNGLTALSPSVYLQLDETEGTTLADASGNGDPTATIVGAPTFEAPSPFGTNAQAIGIGGDAHLEIADSERIESTRAVSFSFWMKTDSFANTWMPLVFKGTTNGNQRSYALWLQNNGNLQFNTADATGNESVNTGASVVQTGQWHHIAASIDRDKGVMQLWVDGVRRAGQGIRTNDIRLNDNPLLVGHTLETSSSYSKFDGTIDELAVWTSAIDSNQLLAPYYESQWLGEPRSTNQLISTFAVGFSESLIPGTVNYQGTNFRTFDGNTYFISNTTRNREDASAYAESFGGNLVTITSQEEQDFINQWLAPQNRDYWLGLRDVAQDDNFAWDTGEALEYTHWWQSYPRPGAEDGVRFNPNSNDGRWWNIRTTDSYNTIVEIQGDQDTDADGIPDVIDRRPNDPLNAWEIRNSGPDQTFDTDDDKTYDVRASFNGSRGANITIADGPLPPGQYRITITDAITDVVGNPLDGDLDGTPGQDFVQFFAVDALPENTVLEQPLNNIRQRATKLELEEDETLPGFFLTENYAVGSQDPATNNTWSDEDWWSFDALNGDRVSITMDTPNSAVNSYVELYDANGRFLAADDNGGPNIDANISGYNIPGDGEYFFRVGSSSNFTGNYQIRIGLSRGTNMETDAQYNNDSIANADGISLIQDGATRSGSIFGLIQGDEGTNRDEDRFNLGILTAGNTVELNLDLPATSTLDGRVFLVDSDGKLVPDDDGDTENATYRATLTSDGTYYADVRANTGQGPNAYYKLNVSLGDAEPPQIQSVSRLPLPAHGRDEYRNGLTALSPSVYLQLDETEGTTLADASGNGDPTATIVGAPTFEAPSPFGTNAQAIGIGGDAHLEIADSERIESTRAVSFSFWMKTDSFANTWMPLVFKGTTNGNQRSYALWLQNNGNLQFNTADATGNESVNTGASVVQTGQWHHIAASIDRDKGVMQLWVDGVRRAGQGIRTNDIRLNDNPLLVGHTLETSSSYSKFDGTIDELAVWTSAIDSNQLLAPYYESQWLGEPRSTNQLISTFAVGFSESLIPGTVNYQGTNFRTFDGNTYFISNTTRNREDASAYAESFGGNLVTITSQEEQDFINQWLAPQNRDYWLGLRDVAQDDNFAWDTGEALEYTHWWQSYPRPGAEDGVRFNPNSNDGRWWNIRTTDAYNTIVEIQGDQDTDADGIPDVIDRRPNDPLNAWEIRNSGPDQTFDTDDDKTYDVRASFNGSRGANITIADGPLPPGQYRITITDAITDLIGNPLDGDFNEEIGGNFVQFFSVEGFSDLYTLETPNNNARESASLLSLTEDPPGSGLFVARGIGSQDPNSNNTWADQDWWAVEALTGDLISISVDTPSNNLNTYLELYDASGRFVASDSDGGSGTDAFVSRFTANTDGIYYARVGSQNSVIGTYEMRFDVARAVQLESDVQYSNDAIGGANTIEYTIDETRRNASVAGTLMAGESGNVDEDYFNLGSVEAGQTILLSTRLPTSSELRPLVEIRNANNEVVSIATNPSDAVARADVSQTGNFYAVMLGASGFGTFGQYLLDVAVQPTDELDFADLVITETSSPANATSGQTIDLSWTVGSFGAVAPSADSWSDRVVLSRNNRYGDEDDIQLARVVRDGALANEESYTVTTQANLPLGLDGTFFLLMQTDADGVVPEFIFEANNVAAFENQLIIAPLPTADLQIENVVAPQETLASSPVTITWDVVNVGEAVTNNGRPDGIVSAWIDRIVISPNDQFGDGDDVVVAEVERDGALESGERYTGNWTGTLPDSSEGSYHVFVETDANEAVLQINNAAPDVAVSAERILVSQVAISDLQVTSITVPPTAATGGEIEVSWTVTNSDTASVTAVDSWLDRIVLSTDNFVGNADDRVLGSLRHTGALASGESYSENSTVQLPSNVTGQFNIFVITDAQNQVNELIFEDNNVSDAAVVSVAVPNLVATTISVTPTTAVFGELLEIVFEVENQGSADAAVNYRDRVYLSRDGSLGTATELRTIPVGDESPLAPGEGYTRQLLVPTPLDASFSDGEYLIIVKTDFNDEQPESDETDTSNRASTTVTLSQPAASDLQSEVLSAPELLQPGESASVSWQVANVGERTAVQDTSSNQQWIDRLYLAQDSDLTGAILLGSVERTENLAQGDNYETSLNFTVPTISDGDYVFVVVSDQSNVVYELGRDDNNTSSSEQVTIRHPNLVPMITASPDSVASGQEVTIGWTTTNQGGAPTLSGFIDRVYLSDDQQVSSNDRLLGEVELSDVLANGQAIVSTITTDIPVDVRGDQFILVQTDATALIIETNDENDNVNAVSLNVDLAPYADLETTNVVAPELTIADPARVEISWTVTNRGVGPGQTAQWTDAIIASRDETVGNGDDIVLATFVRDGELAVGESYTRSESITLPGAFQGRFNLFVVADFEEDVFENELEANNSSSSPAFFDVSPIPYADLVVDSLTPQQAGFSGQPFELTWQVSNQGLDTTNTATWSDRIFMADNPEGDRRIFLANVATGRNFTHIGFVQTGQNYNRTGTVRLPEGIEGEYYFFIETGVSGPYEFIYTDNNSLSAGPVNIELSPPPDLIVEEIVAPELAAEGSAIDVTWRVKNNGLSSAEGRWVDQLILRKFGEETGQRIGSFTFDGPLPAGQSYTRTEQLKLPIHINNEYEIIVVTDFGESVYEHTSEDNNERVDDKTIQISVLPRPDLQVFEIIAPDEVDAGGTASAEFVIINQGPVGTTTPNWTDTVYLSLDDQFTPDDIRVDSLSNEAALEPGEQYRSVTATFEVPIRFRGTVYLIVVADSGRSVDEFPNERNNDVLHELFVNPFPFADLVASEVRAPSVAVEGASFDVGYTVTNLGSGPTNRSSWTEQVWLTRDKNRPHPGQGDFLLTTLQYEDGVLVREAGYDRENISVTLPASLVSDTYYITPWIDPYAQVDEDTLSINVNPDDPNEFDNNNYKARAIEIIGTPPPPIDIAVTDVQAQAVGKATEEFTVTWEVSNVGPGQATGWNDQVFLSKTEDRTAGGSETLLLGNFANARSLESGESYSNTQTFSLPPTAEGMYVHVESTLSDEDSDNNKFTTDTVVTRDIPDLIITDLTTVGLAESGEELLVRYTVENVSDFPIWSGTEFWRDEIWLSKDQDFSITRGSDFLLPSLRSIKVGTATQSNDQPLAPGASYTKEVTVQMPEGIGGEFHMFAFTNVIRDPQSDVRAWPVPASASFRQFEKAGYEDPRNNGATVPLPVEYREPDLRITQLDLPSDITAGQTIEATYTVTNIGNRETRQEEWKDRFFISIDSSLDSQDYRLEEVTEEGTIAAEFEREGILEEGESYEGKVRFTVPFEIDGAFNIIGYVDAGGRGIDRSNRFSSNIADDLPGVAGSGEGDVREFLDEGNNENAVEVNVLPLVPADLQVTEITTPTTAVRGQDLTISFTVENKGGDTLPTQKTWDDLVYLSRDEFLDTRADRFLGTIQRTEGLLAGESYLVEQTFRTPTDLPTDPTNPLQEVAYQVFVVTDPARNTAKGKVFEGSNERNNDLVADEPVVVQFRLRAIWLSPTYPFRATHVQVNPSN